jgi:uncharacterized protein Yka (UPF0111/DUF47 family)
MSKTRVVEMLGEKGLVLPALLNAAILANERAKYVLALLQVAAGNAENPSVESSNLRVEREACGIADGRLDRVVARSEALGPGVYHIPEAARLIAILTASLETMLTPLALTGGGFSDETSASTKMVERKRRLLDAIPPIEGGIVSGETIAALTSGRPAAGDGIHVLVMDLHKEINRLQALIAEEEIAGARAYGIAAADRPLIEAFMAGVQQTAPMKFDHPGLATTAARSGDTLLIQNDIGATEAHVIVLRVSGLTAALTYTDVHPQRLRFFQNALATTGIVWEDLHSRQVSGLGKEDLFYVTVGRIAAADDAGLRAFLERLGSRIVFLIDWNRARKRLGLLVPNALAVDLLNWAAEHDLGHRAFVQLGGERLIYDALEQAVRTPLRYGEKLHEMLGAEAASSYLRFVLETAAAGLRDGRSEMLIRDQIRAELFNHFHSAEQRLLAEGSRHAAIVVRLANGLRQALQQGMALGGDRRAENAQLAKELESQADEVVKSIRSTAQRIAGTEIFRLIVETADDAADHLEDAAFLAAVAPDGGVVHQVPAPLVGLADLVLEGAQSLRRAMEAAPEVRRGGSREPLQNFLEAADRLVIVEHQTDARERDVTVALMATPIDSRQLHLFGEIARHLEEAADAMLRAGLMLRDHIMGNVMFE